MTAPLDDILGAPGSASKVDWQSLYSHLVIIFPHSVETEILTAFGVKDAVRCDIHDVDSGQVMLDALIFPQRLVGQTRRCERGKAVVGRVTLGEPKAGQKPPWQLSDPTPDDFARARAYLAARPPRSVPAQPQQQPAANGAQQQPQWTPQAAQPQPQQQPQWQPTVTAGAPPAPPPASPPAGLTAPAPAGYDDAPF